MKKMIFLFMILSSCAYRSNTDIQFESTVVPNYKSRVVLYEGSFPGKVSQDLGLLTAEVSLHRKWAAPQPTKEQVNYVLIKRAEAIGADAVIDVRYEASEWTWRSWGYISATGKAVKLVPSKSL